MNTLRWMAIAGLLAAGTVIAGDAATSAGSSEFLTRGYITVGSSVLVLPERLAPNDRIAITDAQGVRVFDRTVSGISRFERSSGLTRGTYTLTVTRRSAQIASILVPM